jgi:hypothetical protein
VQADYGQSISSRGVLAPSIRNIVAFRYAPGNQVETGVILSVIKSSLSISFVATPGGMTDLPGYQRIVSW